MKTIFKEGMEVYDEVFFGKTPLKITEVKADMSLRVLYGEVTYCYTGDGRFIGDDITSNRWRPLSQTPTLSTSPYTLQGFEQKAPIPTFEEAVKWLESTEGTNIMKDSVFLTKGNYYTNLNECTEALKKLVILRDYYNEGWQPDWKSSKGFWKHSIVCYEGKIHKDLSYKISMIFTFKTEEIRDKFLEEQRELLEIAKPLL